MPVRSIRRCLVAVGTLALVGMICGGLAWKHSPLAPDAATSSHERAHTPSGMVYVAGGDCLLGSDDADADEDARPMRRVFVPSFYIDRTCVTHEQFKRFRPSYTYQPGEDNLPVTNVTYAEANAYAHWAGKRLPTEMEWEKAARGIDGRRYPWGNTWNPRYVATRAHPTTTGAQQEAALKRPGQCALTRSRVQPVGSVPSGASPYGCLDMAGNAWQWVQGYYQGNPERRILRGGAVGYGERSCRTYARSIEGAGVT